MASIVGLVSAPFLGHPLSVDPGPRRICVKQLRFEKNDWPGPPTTQKVSSPLTQNSFALEDLTLIASSADPINLGLCHAKSLMRTEHKSFLHWRKSAFCVDTKAFWVVVGGPDKSINRWLWMQKLFLRLRRRRTRGPVSIKKWTQKLFLRCRRTRLIVDAPNLNEMSLAFGLTA